MRKQITSAGTRWMKDNTEELKQQSIALTRLEKALVNLDGAITAAITAYDEVTQAKITKSRIFKYVQAPDQAKEALTTLLKRSAQPRKPKPEPFTPIETPTNDAEQYEHQEQEHYE